MWLHAIPRSLLEDSCTGVPPVKMRVLTNNCPDRATELREHVTWHFMRGSASWPYRPETQQDAFRADLLRRAVDVDRPATSPPRHTFAIANTNALPAREFDAAHVRAIAGQLPGD
ncbi:MAG UNVERIFIED_CONTAM: hypothetical protein LVR18_22060 [Planctomycetaceae bacterium]